MKVHFHSDCHFFAGCENMLAAFFGSPDLRRSYEISFSYRNSEAYTSGLHKRVKVDFQTYALTLPDASAIDCHTPGLPEGVARLVASALRAGLRLPMFFYDVAVLVRLFRRIQPQILHINNGNYPGALSCRAAAVAAKIAGIKNVLMVVNNLATPYTDSRRWLDYPVDHWVARSITQFITGSRAAAIRLQQVLPLKPGQAIPLHNGIKPRELSESISETRGRLRVGNFDGVLFGVVAIMEKRKGHRVLLEALADLFQTAPAALSNIMVLMEGDGSQRAELEEFVRAASLEGRVRFVGTEESIFDFIHALDVLVLPSIENEDFPNVILEAMALGKPVIASRLAGTPEQIEDGITGWLVAPGSAVELAQKMAAFVENREWISLMGARARVRFEENFTAAVAVSRYLDLYRNLLSRSKN